MFFTPTDATSNAAAGAAPFAAATTTSPTSSSFGNSTPSSATTTYFAPQQMPPLYAPAPAMVSHPTAPFATYQHHHFAPHQHQQQQHPIFLSNSGLTMVDASGHHHHLYSAVPTQQQQQHHTALYHPLAFTPTAGAAPFSHQQHQPLAPPATTAQFHPLPFLATPTKVMMTPTDFVSTPADQPSSLLQWPGAASTPFIAPQMMMSLPSFNASLSDPARLSPETSDSTSTPPSEIRFSSSKQKRSNKPLEIPPPAPGQTDRLQLVVHYLAPEITDAGLRQLFGSLDGFTHARVAMESGTGRSRGFGYVWFSSQAAAMNAIEETNGRVLMRKRVRVVFAVPQSHPW